jgi:hypothetical protein
MRSRHEVTSPRAPWRAVYAGPLVALGALALAFVVTGLAGVPLRDPDGVASARLLVALALVACLVAIDVAVRAAARSGRRRPSRTMLVAVARERWNGRRIVPLCTALFAFFVTYFAYRNLKSVVPLIRPDELFDRQLTDLDTGLFGGEQPGALLHQLLGTGLAAHVLSAGYMLLFVFIPVTLAAALVFSTQLEAGLFYATALSLNWVVGAATYFLLPSIGPFDVDPAAFSNLPGTGVAEMQSWLLDERAQFLANPTAPGAAQSIGAFASLHVSIFVTGALTAHLLGLRRPIKATLWVLTTLTVLSTIYFGWHYILDDLGGAVVAVMALAFARALTGFNLGTARQEAPALAAAERA